MSPAAPAISPFAFWARRRPGYGLRHQRRHDRRRPSPRRRPLARRWQLDPGDAENLPFPARAMDRYTIAFGLRNVTDIDRAWPKRSALKIGGSPCAWSFPRSKIRFWYQLYERFSFDVLRIGARVAGDRTLTSIWSKASADFRPRKLGGLPTGPRLRPGAGADLSGGTPPCTRPGGCKRARRAALRHMGGCSP